MGDGCHWVWVFTIPGTRGLDASLRQHGVSMVRSTQRIGVGHHVAWISHLNGGSSPVVPVVNGSGRLEKLMVLAWTEYTRLVSAGRFTP